MIISEAQEYQEIFDEYMNSEQFIITKPSKKRETYVYPIDRNEIWKQCYDPNVKERRDYPKYWFVSRPSAHVVSVYNGEVYLLLPEENKEGYLSYGFYRYTENGERKYRKIKAHILAATTFGINVYGKAKDILEEEGIDGFGLKYEDDKMNAHHENGIKDNDAEHIGISMSYVHRFLHKLPDRNASVEERLQFYSDLSTLAAQEEPHAITVLLTGETYNRKTGEYRNDGHVSIRAFDGRNADNILKIKQHAFDNVVAIAQQ